MVAQGRFELCLGHLGPPFDVATPRLLVELVPGAASAAVMGPQSAPTARRDVVGRGRARFGASPARARSLLTVRAAISSATSSVAVLVSSRPSLMCSYWRSRLALHADWGTLSLLSRVSGVRCQVSGTACRRRARVSWSPIDSNPAASASRASRTSCSGPACSHLIVQPITVTASLYPSGASPKRWHRAGAPSGCGAPGRRFRAHCVVASPGTPAGHPLTHLRAHNPLFGG